MASPIKQNSKFSIVCCSEIQDPTWRWIERSLPDFGATFIFVHCSAVGSFRRFNLGRMVGCFRAVRAARKTKASIIVAHGPALAAWCCIFASIMNCREVEILAHSFNFTDLPGAFKTWIFSLVLGRAKRFVVFSRMERDLYARVFRIDINKLDFIHWGVNQPKIDNEPIEEGAYIASIGGNARDYRTLIDAARTMPGTKFVLVVRPENLRGLDIPSNIKVHTNLPLRAAMNVLGHSKLMALPLMGSQVPCGHVTLVAAMHLARPVIVTDSTGIADYVENGVTGLTVRMGSAIELKRAIEGLLSNGDLSRSLAYNGRRFAAIYCSEQSIAKHFYEWVMSLAQPH